MCGRDLRPVALPNPSAQVAELAAPAAALHVVGSACIMVDAVADRDARAVVCSTRRWGLAGEVWYGRGRGMPHPFLRLPAMSRPSRCSCFPLHFTDISCEVK